MKKILLISLAGIIIGGIFAFFVFSDIEEEVEALVSNDTKVTAFQVGVFNIYENALKTKGTYENSYIYKDEDKYRVFIAIYQDSEIIKNMENYYRINNISFYLKEINSSGKFINELLKYEKLLKETDDINTYVSANKNILKTFGESL